MGPIENWPLQDSSSSGNMGRDDTHQQGINASLEPANIAGVAAELRRWAPAILDAQQPDDRGGERLAIEDCLKKLDTWCCSLLEAQGQLFQQGRATKMRHDSKRLLECIRFSRCLSGGPDQLIQAIQRALALALPPTMSGILLKSFDSNAHILVPSPSLMRHYEIAIDIAFVLLQRRVCAADVVRYRWSDSSPLAGFDWLWTQHHEIRRSKLVETFNALVSLENAMNDCITEVAESMDLDIECDGPMLRAFQAQESWSEWLRAIRTNIVEHIHPPAALGSGHLSVADKVKAIVFTWPSSQIVQCRCHFMPAAWCRIRLIWALR